MHMWSDSSDVTIFKYTGILLDQVKSECETNQFQCDNGQCIAKRGRCNGILDCTDNSDETFIQCGSIT